MMICYPLATTKRGPFTIDLEYADEQSYIQDLFDESEAWYDETNDAILNGTMSWIILCGRLHCNGIELSSNRIGGILCKSPKSLINEDREIADDLIDELVVLAKDQIARFKDFDLSSV